MRADRVVLDTNVLISGALWSGGAPRSVVNAIAGQNGMLLFSDETFEELHTRLMKEKFDAYAGRPLRAAFLSRVRAVSQWVWIAGTVMGCRDPDDDKLLETALMGDADVLVSGDRDLLEMDGSFAFPILAPARFLERFSRS